VSGLLGGWVRTDSGDGLLLGERASREGNGPKPRLEWAGRKGIKGKEKGSWVSAQEGLEELEKKSFLFRIFYELQTRLNQIQIETPNGIYSQKKYKSTQQFKRKKCRRHEMQQSNI
jgi:hypothetical protein